MPDYWINVNGGTGSGGDLYQSVTLDSLGHIIVAGYTNSDGAGGYDLVLAKYNSTGTLLWVRLLGESVNELAHGVITDSSDNIIVVGQTDSVGAGDYDALLAKYDSSGTLLWDRTLGGTLFDRNNSVAVDSSNNIIAVGYTQSDGAGSNDVLIAKYNSSGILQWDRTLGGTGTDLARGVVVDSSDNIIMVGYTESDGAGGNDLLLAKYNSSGTLQWDKTLGGFSTEYGSGITLDSSGNIIVVGETSSTGAGNNDILLAKYNSSGTLQWQRTLGGTGYESGYGVDVDSTDNIVICGLTTSDGAGNDDILIAKYNSSGTLLWDRTLGGTGNDVGYGLVVDSNDNIVVCGSTNSDGAGSYDVLLAKLPSDGTGTGVYGPFTYQDAVLTSATSTLTDAAAVLTDAPAVLTDSAASLTEIELYTLTEMVEA